MSTTNYLQIEPEYIHSVDEQIIPPKTKRSVSVHQYNPKNPHKQGFKNIVTAGQLGITYNFFIQGDKNDNSGNPLTTKDTVLKLSTDISKNEGFQIYFDKWFPAMELMRALKLFGIFSTATFTTNCLNGCLLSTKKEL